jgi:hypothetical protein
MKELERLRLESQSLEQQQRGVPLMDVPQSVFDKNRQLQKDFNSFVEREVLGVGKQPAPPSGPSSITTTRPPTPTSQPTPPASGSKKLPAGEPIASVKTGTQSSPVGSVEAGIGQLPPSTLSSLTTPMNMNTAGTTPSGVPELKDLNNTATIQNLTQSGTPIANTIGGGIRYSLPNDAAVEVRKDGQAATYEPGKTTKEMADLSARAYKTTKKELNQVIELSDGSSAKVLKSYKDETGTGFQATAYQLQDGRVVVAYAGSQDLTDMKTWSSIGIQHAQELNGEKLNTLNLQVKQARMFYDDTKKYYGIVSVVTGHSLGGALAQVVGAEQGVNTETFSAPGMAGFIQKLNKLNEKDYKITGTGKTINHIRKNDLVGHTGQHSGNVIEYDSYNEPNALIRSNMGAGPLIPIVRQENTHDRDNFAKDINSGQFVGTVTTERSQSGGGASPPALTPPPNATANTSRVSASKGQASSNAQGGPPTHVADEKAKLQKALDTMERRLAVVPPSPASTSSIYSRILPSGERTLDSSQQAWTTGMDFTAKAARERGQAERALQSGDMEGTKLHLRRAQSLEQSASQSFSAAAGQNSQMLDRQIAQTTAVQQTSFIAGEVVATAVGGSAGRAAWKTFTGATEFTVDALNVGVGKAALNVAKKQAAEFVVGKAVGGIEKIVDMPLTPNIKLIDTHIKMGDVLTPVERGAIAVANTGYGVLKGKAAEKLVESVHGGLKVPSGEVLRSDMAGTTPMAILRPEQREILR